MYKHEKGTTARDNFIVEKAKTLTINEIHLLLKREGFAPVSRTRIYQVIEKAKLEAEAREKAAKRVLRQK